MRSIKSEAIVLKKKDLLNKDLLVFLFSKYAGKIAVIVKGVKKITSRRASHLQTGNLLKVHIHKNNDIIYLEQSSLISGFSELKKDNKKINILYKYLFVLERLLPENQKEETAYQLTKLFLIKLSQSVSNDNILSFFLNKLLKVLGYTKKEHEISELEEIISNLIDEKLPWFIIYND